MSSPSTRKQCDFTKLIMHNYEVDLNDGSTQNFYVNFWGPKDTIYEGAVYRIHVELPDQYPFSSPSIGFEPHTMFHPNIDERSGSVCLDVINQTWTPLYSLVNIFDVFLPQLLTYPNPSDPLNSDAATLFLKDTKKYEEKVKEFVNISLQKYEARQRQKSNEEASQSQDSEAQPASTNDGLDTCDFTLNAHSGDDDIDLDLEFDD